VVAAMFPVLSVKHLDARYHFAIIAVGGFIKKAELRKLERAGCYQKL